MEAQPPPIFIIVPGKVYRRDSDATHSPMFHQVEGLAIGEGITLADLQGTLRGDAAGDLRRRAARRACGRTSSPSPSPASSSTSPASSATAPARSAGGERCNLCKGIGWIEVGGAGMVDPNVLGFVEAQRLRPRAGPGLRLRHGGRADRDAAPRRPRPAPLLRQRRADAGAVLMRVPLLMAARVLRPRRRRRGARRAAGDDRDRGRAGRRRRAALGRGLRRRQGARRASSTPTPTGSASARSTPATASRARSSAAPPTSPPARPSPSRCPGRRCRAARSSRKAKLRGRRLRRDDPLRRPSSSSARTPTGSSSSTTGPAPGTPLAEVLPLAEPVLELEVTPNRVDCFGVYGVAREVHAITGAPLGRRALGRGRARPRARGRSADHASVTVEVPELCPRFTARVFTDVDDRPLAGSGCRRG